MVVTGGRTCPPRAKIPAPTIYLKTSQMEQCCGWALQAIPLLGEELKLISEQTLNEVFIIELQTTEIIGRKNVRAA
jgi:hypothetical protein